MRLSLSEVTGLTVRPSDTRDEALRGWIPLHKHLECFKDELEFYVGECYTMLALELQGSRRTMILERLVGKISRSERSLVRKQLEDLIKRLSDEGK